MIEASVYETTVKRMPLRKRLQFVRLIMVAIFIIGFIIPLPSAVSAHPLSALAPTVTSVSPNQGYNYQPTTITLTGSDFVATPTAQLNNVSLTNVTFMDSATLTATVPADLPGGTYMLTVTNPDSQSASLASAFTVLLSGDGSLGFWQTTSPMTTPRQCPAAVAANSYLYALGGMNNYVVLNSVERVAIGADGSVGTWQATSPMSSSRRCPSAVTANGYVYVLGGEGLSSVERAIINSDGSLGPWKPSTSMSASRPGLAALFAHGYIYIIGGSNGMQAWNSIERAVVNPDGSIGPWQATTPMNTARGYLTAVAVGNYIYAIGGQNNQMSAPSLRIVERTTINSDGSLGSWQDVTSMTTPRCDFAAVAVGGYIYALGGGSCTGPFYSSVERAWVNTDGSLDLWKTMPSMTVSRILLTAVQSNTSVYAIGGTNTGGDLSSVERAEVSRPSMTSLSPSAVRSDQPTTVTANGANILPTPILRLGDSTTLTSSFVSTTTVSATIPSGLANGWYTVTLTNGDGRVATLLNALRVDGPGPVLLGDYGLSINDGALFTNQVTVTLSISSRPDTAQMQASNDGGFAGASWETYTSHKTWQITQYGSYVLPRVVYVRYKDLAGSMSATFQDDIILDVTPPVGSVTIAPVIAGMRESASTPTPQVGASSTQTFTVYLPFIFKPLQVNLLLTATDDVSGVGGMLISNNMDFSGANWEVYASQKNWQVPSTGTITVYVKFRDNAGNVSLVYSATYTP